MQLWNPRQLSKILDVPLPALRDVSTSIEQHCPLLEIANPGDPNFKPRVVCDPSNQLRLIQKRLNDRIFLPHFQPSPYSYGGVRGRHIRQNAEAHRGSRFGLTKDISRFYPSIHHGRVYRLFALRMSWHPDVARLATMLCTCDHQLRLGLITSPIIANEILKPIDRRIGAACDELGLKYTRFVDDITISGGFDLSSKCAGVSSLIDQIMRSSGFRMKAAKDVCGAFDSGLEVTKLRIRNGRVDVRREYAEEIERRLNDAGSLAAGQPFDGPYFTRNQLLGQIQFISWINPGRRLHFRRRFGSVNWRAAHAEAERRGLVRSQKVGVPVDRVRRRMDRDGAPAARPNGKSG